MGSKELLDSLRKEGEEKVQAVRDNAEAEEAGIKADKARRIERLRSMFKDKEARLVKSLEADLLSAAEKRARVTRLSAEKALAERLFNLSLKCLQGLREEGYDSLLSTLVQELPAAPWRYVRVNPADTGRVPAYFPEAEIVPDDNITGGIEVAVDDSRIHVINTFEKRLERAWDEILPSLIRDIYEETAKHESSSGN